MYPKEAQLNNHFLIFHQDKILLNAQNPPQGNINSLPYRHALGAHHLIGELDGMAVYCAKWRSTVPLFSTLQPTPLRQALPHLRAAWFPLIARAIAILEWEKNHRFCGHCGALTTRVENLFEMHCANCQLNFYPRISPSVIVLIERGDDLLMAQGLHFAPGVFGLIAGFVEAGETLEEAVHREVSEEVGLKITNLRYIGSQPWPFPDSLVAAFRADYLSGEIVIDQNEIASAGWYRYDNLPGYPSSRISIARRLIEQFIDEKANT